MAIRRDTQAGIPANELIDQRDKLIMKLADQIGATVKPGEDGTVDVYVGGTALVRGSTVQKLQVTGATTFDQTSCRRRRMPVVVLGVRRLSRGDRAG